MKTPYTYSILRYVHDPAAGEFLNVGVALYSPEARYAGALCRTTYGRLSKAFPGMNGDSFRDVMRYIQSRFEKLGERLGAELDLEAPAGGVLELAHAVLPPDDSSLQWSPPGGGLTEDPAKTLESLYARLVYGYEDHVAKTSRSDEQVWAVYRRGLESRRLLSRFTEKRISAADDAIEFDHAYKNGLWHCLKPISLDLAQSDSIMHKAHAWLGHITSVRDAPDPFKVYLLLGQPERNDLLPAYRNAMRILDKIPGDKEIIPEEDAERVADELAKLILPTAV